MKAVSMSKAVLMSLVAILVIGAGLAQAVPLIPNGSFELGNFVPTGPGYMTLSGGATDITGWTVQPDTIDWVYKDLWKASDGDYSLDLSGLDAGGISVTGGFATIIGRQYVLTFDLAGDPLLPNDPQPVKTLKVTVGSAFGFVEDTFTFDVTGKDANNMGWLSQSMTFTANDVTTYVLFTSLTRGAYGPALDNVGAELLPEEPPPPPGPEPVPEPTSLLLLGTGLAGLALAARQRRK